MKAKTEKKTKRKSASDATNATLAQSPTEMLGEAPESSELLGVPYLGAIRTQALAESGITTLVQLRAASADQIGSVKGVGLRNAVRIKEWLERQSPPKSEKAGKNPTTVHSPLPADREGIDGAVSRIKEANPKKALDKRLSRQLEKVLSRVAGVPATLESLGLKEKQQAAKALDRVAHLLAATADRGRLSDKKQQVVGGAIKARLKKLEKVLED